MRGVAAFDTGRLCGSRTNRGYNQSTASGMPFWSQDPRMEDVRITDIAAQLARICRFGGALRNDVAIYTVAQHCCLVSDHCPDAYKLEGLLHDAAEAYIGDMIKPVKMQLSEWKAIERRIDKVIRDKFGLPTVLSPAVKEQDYFAVSTEHRDVQAPNKGVDWGTLPTPWKTHIRPWGVFRARNEFMRRFMELYGD